MTPPDAPQDDVHAMEERWLDFWEQEGVHRFDAEDTERPIYAIDTPPPTVSGKMHIGHAYSYSQMDFVARYKRMRGYNLFYPFGLDDNGLPTERYTEKRVGVSIEEVGRKEFIRLCLQETRKAEEAMERAWRRIGTSCDWSLLYRTIDELPRKTSQASFLDLWEKDLAYRRESPTIWCPECRTAIAQVETEDRDLDSTFNDIRFDLVEGSGGDGPDHLVIATTRPELLPACVAVFVHPDDPRAAELEGRHARVPIFGQEVPILASDRVDREKGTGVVMCCTFGDLTDIDWYYAHDLPLAVAIDERGILTERGGAYEGMPTHEARRAILEDLDAEGTLLAQRPIVHTVNVHERCGTPIEFLVSKQWFVKYLDHRETFLERGEELDWHPPYMKARYDNWVSGLQWDWCISRQRVFGVPFPVWYCDACDAVVVAERDELPVDPTEGGPGRPCPQCGGTDLRPEEDILDTWATSSMTPQIAARWVEDASLFDRVFPYDLRPQAHDIISFWAFNTIVKSHYHHGELPWSDIMVSGFVKLESGKMSKSKGNIIEPMDIVEKYSGDALRYWSATGASLGEDIIYREKELVRGQRLLTKLRNVTGFIGTHLEGQEVTPVPPEDLHLVDRWILTAYSRLIRDVTERWEDFDYSRAVKDVETFLWHVVADHYLELAKPRLFDGEGDPAGAASARWTLRTVGLGLLKLLAPVLCFTAEDLYQEVYRDLEGDVSVHVSAWPEPLLEDAHALERGEVVKDVVAAVRSWKSERGLPLNAEIPALEIVAPAAAEAALEAAEATIVGTLKAAGLAFIEPGDVQEVPVALEPVHAKLGPKHRSDAPKVVAALQALDPAHVELPVTLQVEGREVTVEPGEVNVVRRPTVHGEAVEVLHAGAVSVMVREP